MSLRPIGLAGALLAALLAVVGCSREAEKVVESWESLGSDLEKHASDCGALAEALRAYQRDNATLFAADMQPIYQEIADTPELRFRLERALAAVHEKDYVCRNDPRVHAAAAELFDELLEATGANEAQAAAAAGKPATDSPRKP